LVRQNVGVNQVFSFKGFGSFRSGEMNSQKLERSPAHQRERATAEEGQPMMRLPRTAALLAAFSLLASAATAYNRLLLVVGLLLATSSPAVAQQVWFKWVSTASFKDKAQLFLQAFTKEADSWKRGAAFDTKRQCAASLPRFGDKGALGDGMPSLAKIQRWYGSKARRRGSS
jgi:hypothetical protein